MISEEKQWYYMILIASHRIVLGDVMGGPPLGVLHGVDIYGEIIRTLGVNGKYEEHLYCNIWRMKSKNGETDEDKVKEITVSSFLEDEQRLDAATC